MNDDPSPVRPGDIIAGKYRVERLLGKGGMGVVVAATHLDLLELRALKFMLPTALPDAETIERFLREARAASRLKTEHVARVHDVGRLPDGSLYMVMEYLEGSDLGAKCRQGGVLSVEEAVLYIVQAADALAEAHAAGIVHRDLKPANLFVTQQPDGTPCIKVLDFGISKVLDSTGADYDMTKTHTVLGSPHYMSPEQMHSSRDVDPRSDIWSLGVILYALITGKLPFRGRSITEIVANVMLSPPVPPSHLAPNVPPGFDAALLRCLERDRNARYANVGDLARALYAFAPPIAGHTIQRILRLTSAPRAAMPSVVGLGPDFQPTGMTPSLALPYATPPLPLPLPMSSGAGQPIPPPPSSRSGLQHTLPQPPSSSGGAPHRPFTPAYTPPHPIAPQPPSSYPGALPTFSSTAAVTPPPASGPGGFIPMPPGSGPGVAPHDPRAHLSLPGLAATGAWGNTAAGLMPGAKRRSNTPLIIASAVAAVLAAGITGALLFSGPSSSSNQSDKPSGAAAAAAASALPAPSSSAPDPTSAPPKPASDLTAPPASPTLTAAASQPPQDAPPAQAPSGAAAPTATAPKIRKGPASDPFGMERK
jgi:serine/threonine protein kinase